MLSRVMGCVQRLLQPTWPDADTEDQDSHGLWREASNRWRESVDRWIRIDEALEMYLISDVLSVIKRYARQQWILALCRASCRSYNQSRNAWELDAGFDWLSVGHHSGDSHDSHDSDDSLSRFCTHRDGAMMGMDLHIVSVRGHTVLNMQTGERRSLPSFNLKGFGGGIGCHQGVLTHGNQLLVWTPTHLLTYDVTMGWQHVAHGRLLNPSYTVVLMDEWFYCFGQTDYSILRYHATANHWDYSTSRDNSFIQRRSSAAAVLNNHIIVCGGMMFVGGEVEPLTLCQRYDPRRGVCTLIANMHVPRVEARAVTVDGCLFVIGGLYGSHNEGASDSMEQYDPVRNQWLLRPGLPMSESTMVVVV